MVLSFRPLIGLIFFFSASLSIQASKPTKIDFDELGQMLQQMGMDPKPWSDTFHQITITRDEWPVQVLISFSPDQSKIWLESRFSVIENSDQVPSEAWKKLLSENEKIAPAHFVFRKEDMRIHLYKAIDNRDVELTFLRKEIENFDAVVRKTYPVWSDQRFRTSGLELAPMPREMPFSNVGVQVSSPTVLQPIQFTTPTSPELGPQPREVRPSEEMESALKRLQGTWNILTIEVKGQKAPDDSLKTYHPTMIFNGKQAIFKSGIDTDKQMIIQLDPTQVTKQIDFIDEKKQIEKGIYNLDDDLLTICFASPGESRPTEFATTPEKSIWLIMLRRAK
jgi:uncharacterized protein (TIGR03067 family)